MEQDQSARGALLALCAYLLWGLAPVYFKQLLAVPAPEILAHRVVWSCLLLLGLITAMGYWTRVRALLRRPQLLLLLLVSSLVIGTNWLVFIWAVNNNHILDASLGYYINPLLNIVLGMVFLKERYRPLQWLAVGLAALGVLVQLLVFGRLPWVALVLALSFGTYGLIRKQVPVDPFTGLLLETSVLLVPALWWLWGLDSVTGNLTANPAGLNLLLLAAGLVTTVPLLLFAGAASRLRLSTLGFFQYLAPSLALLLGVLVYGEAFTTDKAITFALIWTALAIYSADGLRQRRRVKRVRGEG